MSGAKQTAVVVGAGVFGTTAALALARRGYAVSLLDQLTGPEPLPHPLAASTDISKVIRMDYGADVDYTAWMEAALDGWRRWNRDWSEHREDPLFHETGVVCLTRAALCPGTFEYESYRLLRERGHQLERLDAQAIRQRFPAWNSDLFIDGYFNPEGGYAESSRVVAQLLRLAEQAGVALIAGQRVERLLQEGERACGVITHGGAQIRADRVVLTVGAWTPYQFPFLAAELRAVGQPVFHLRPRSAAQYQAKQFPVFFADIANTGYYGFPMSREGVVKIANHGIGKELHPESPERLVSSHQTAQLRQFLKDAVPDLADAEIVHTRVCLYADTWDEHLWIAPDPERPGLIVATGDSGHSFKFAPVLGELIADAVQGQGHPLLHKFRHRPGLRTVGVHGQEAARYHG